MAKISPLKDPIDTDEFPEQISERRRGSIQATMSRERKAMVPKPKQRSGSLYVDSTYAPQQQRTGRSQSILDDHGLTAQVHHHVHQHQHHHHHHHSVILEGGRGLENEEDGEEDEELTEAWREGFPVLTKNFYNSLGKRTSRGSLMTTPCRPAQAKDFFHERQVLCCSFFSIVVQAMMKCSKELVCIKMVRKNCDKEKRKYTLAEQKVLDDYGHLSPFIVQLHSSFQTKLHVYMVIEFVEGGSLERRQQIVGVYPEKVTVFYLAEIALAAFFLHDRGVLHRDMRCCNTMLRANGHICLIDFGLCKYNMKNKFTSTMLGSRKEMAPEIFHNVPYNKAVDYWAMGTLLYTLLHGQVPFQGRTRVDVFKSVTTERETYSKNLSTYSKTLCKALLRKNQRARLGYDQHSAELMKGHPFFTDVRWQRMEKLHYHPPYIPESNTSDDNRILTEFNWPELSEQNIMLDNAKHPGGPRMSVVPLDSRLSLVDASFGGDSSSLTTLLEKKFSGTSNGRSLETQIGSLGGGKTIADNQKKKRRLSVLLMVPEVGGSKAVPKPFPYLVCRTESNSQVTNIPDTSHENSKGGDWDDVMVYKLNKAQPSLKQWMHDCLSRCWRSYVNYCRTLSANCRGVCCGLENVKAPVMVSTSPLPYVMSPTSLQELEEFYKIPVDLVKQVGHPSRDSEGAIQPGKAADQDPQPSSEPDSKREPPHGSFPSGSGCGSGGGGGGGGGSGGGGVKCVTDSDY